jgi:hypothetical protein
MKRLSKEDAQKVYSAIADTIRLIEEENKISYDLRKHDFVKKYENHLNKLYKMIEVGEIF